MGNENSLISAIKAQDLFRVKLLLAGVDYAERLEELDEDCKGNAVFMAAGMGSEEILRAVLSRATLADIEAKDRKGLTPLAVAIFNGHTKCVEALLEAKADPNGLSSYLGLCTLDMQFVLRIDSTKSHKATPLHWSVLVEKIDVIETLLKFGASVDGLNEDGMTPLALAVHYGKTEVAKVLLKNGANIHLTLMYRNRRFTPLKLAIRNGNKKMIELLKTYEGEPNVEEKQESRLSADVISVESP